MINLCNSYPECHWFESDRRYQKIREVCESLTDCFLRGSREYFAPKQY